MVILGPISTIFDVATFAIMYFYFGCRTNDPAQVALFNSAWFIEAALTQTVVIYVLRSRKIAFVQTVPGKSVVGSTIASAAVCTAVPFIPAINSGLQFVDESKVQWLNNNPIFWAWLVGLILGYIVLAEFTKKLYIKVNHREWI